MSAALANTGTLRFHVCEQRVAASLFPDFLKRLLKYPKGRKLMLLVDDHPAHRAKIVRDYLPVNPELIALHFLPRYNSPLAVSRVPSGAL